MTVVVTGFRELNQTFAKASKETNRAVKAEYRQLAEPVRREASIRAQVTIRNITPAWSSMRTGVTQKAVYVAPRKRGVRGRNARARPNLAGLLMDRAMEPALKRNEPLVERDLEQVLDRIADRFNRG